MIVTGFSQNTPEWLSWRRKHVCASEIPALMGESDFSTPFEIWKQKTGRAKEKESNWAMVRGNEKEPVVRSLYALENMLDIPPTLVEHDDLSFLGASLDGYNSEKNLIVEIKYTGKDKHNLAKNGEVPECYRGQIQAQLFCSGAEFCDYVSYSDPEIAVVRVGRDEEYIRKMIVVARYFYEQYMLKDAPPPLTERDYLELSDKESMALFEEWRVIKLIQMQLDDIDAPTSEIKSIESRLERAREAIKNWIKHPKVICNGVKVITVKRKTGPTLDIRFAEV